VTAQLFPGSALFLVPFAIVATAVFAVVAAVTARRDPDPAGTRPYAIYLSLALFVTVFTALFAATALVSSLVRIPLKDNPFASVGSTGHLGVSSSSPLESRLNEGHIGAAVLAALVVVAAVVVMWFHVRRLRELVREPGFDSSPGRRTYQVYLHAVTFVSTVILLFAGAAAVYGLFRAISPSTTGPFVAPSAERGEGIAQAVSTGFLALAAYAVFVYHWHRTRTLRGAGPLRPRGRHSGPPPRPPSPPEPPKPAEQADAVEPPEPSAPAEPPEPSATPSEEAPPPVAPPI
jgi:hypothetical protein